jgi:hypothetical protein
MDGPDGKPPLTITLDGTVVGIDFDGERFTTAARRPSRPPEMRRGELRPPR